MIQPDPRPDPHTDGQGSSAPAAALHRPMLLRLAALLLAATAVFHLTGLSMVSGWFEGDRRSVMILLWIAPAATWLLVAAHWLFPGARISVPDWPVLLLTALIPLIVAVPLVALVPQHPGGYLLLAASVLALLSRKAGA